MKNIDAFLYAPVMAGVWNQHQLWDGTYSFDDLLDIHEILDVQNENHSRAIEHSQMEGGI